MPLTGATGDNLVSVVCSFPYAVDELGEVTVADEIVQGNVDTVEIEFGRDRLGVDGNCGLV